MTPFDAVVMVDWSARATPSPKRPSADAIWIAEAEPGGTAQAPRYFTTRAAACDWLAARLAAAVSAGERVLAGFDFPFGYPAGFAAGITRRADAPSLWADLAARIADGDDNANNRFAVAADLNARFPGVGPFWGRPAAPEVPGLPTRGGARHGHGLPERRAAETRVARAQSCWKLYTTGSVGSQALLGIARLQALRAALGPACAVWPFEDADAAPVVLAEIYPGLIDDAVRARLAAEPDAIKDAVQVAACAEAFAALAASGALPALMADVPDGPPRREEGWILGLGHEAALSEAAQSAARAAARPDLVPPRLRNDCFALPQGVDWTPVDAALAALRARLGPVVGAERVATAGASGRVLAADAVAARSNPPGANAAVDGYGFAAAMTGPGRQVLPLVAGRAAAGAPFAGRVPAGAAVRILTGALVPEGVDTVVLEEDCATGDGHVAFDGPVKPGANTRRAGEDVAAGAVALRAGRVLTPADVALATALGLPEMSVFARLRVGVLSTGDELAAPGPVPAAPDVTYDANRPMLLALAEGWGHAAVDLGPVGDDRAALAATLDAAAGSVDAILTSGGASAGDEDHVSALLREAGALATWRVAVKPGRPLALGMWRGVPVFGLPGNPVAAFVCTLVFARPALAAMAGADWPDPRGFAVPAAFSKRKKPGRREYLRARIDADGRAEVFASEGSGRISGLSWAEGLVELPDGGMEIAPGDPVTYYPFASFGL